MYQVYGLLCMILSSAEASSNQILSPRRPRAAAKTNEVVSLTFCESSLSAEDKMGKETLEKVHTYAQLRPSDVTPVHLFLIKDAKSGKHGKHTCAIFAPKLC